MISVSNPVELCDPDWTLSETSELSSSWNLARETFLFSSSLKSCWCQSSEVLLWFVLADWSQLLPQPCSPFTYFIITYLIYGHQKPRKLTLNSLQFIPGSINLSVLKCTISIYTDFCFTQHFLPPCLSSSLKAKQTKMWWVRKLNECLNSPPVGAYPAQYSLDESIHYDCWSSHSSVQMGAAAAWRGCTLRASFTTVYNYCKPQYGGQWLNWVSLTMFISPFLSASALCRDGWNKFKVAGLIYIFK